MREILTDIERWRNEGQRIAIATVIKTVGSTPRPLGSKMAVSESGSIAGSVSGLTFTNHWRDRYGSTTVEQR